MSRMLLEVILLLSPAWTFAHGSTLPTDQNPTSNPPARTIEGCLSSIDDAFVLTAANGKRYELTGDIAQLTARSGNKVRISGHADNTKEAELMVAAGPYAAFAVDKIESLSSACK